LLNDNVPYLKVYDGRINLRTFEFIKDIENLLNESVYLLKGELKLERIILKEGD
jgi:rRNA maturation protein Rpf1